MTKPRDVWIRIGMAVVLFLLAIFPYLSVLGADFVSYDDRLYVAQNSAVQNGFTLKAAGWSFTTFQGGSWHPVTWFSHLLDMELFGLTPTGHHAHNLLLHAVNVVLLFFLLSAMTGAPGKSAAVAVLFAMHPLNTETVAWVAERKNLLSTTFWFLTTGAYLAYVRRPSLSRYLPVFALFILGLMTKPMLVTLPVILILLDVWPLKRIPLCSPLPRLPFFDKVPLLILSAAFSVVTVIAQHSQGALSTLQGISLWERIWVAFHGYVTYCRLLLWPAGLMVIYPLPNSFPLIHFIISAAIIISLTALAFFLLRTHPAPAVGWLWFLITLGPVIGIIHVGLQAVANRYTYLPAIGFFLALAWTTAGLLGRSKWRKIIGVAAFLLLIPLMSVITWKQSLHWKNTSRLFEHALKIDPNNWAAHHGLGLAYLDEGDLERALFHLEESVRGNPVFADAYYGLGYVYWAMGKEREAVGAFSRAISLAPEVVRDRYAVGWILNKGKEPLSDTIPGPELFSTLLPAATTPAPADPLLTPDDPLLIGMNLLEDGKAEKAVEVLSQALKSQPGRHDLSNGLGIALMKAGRHLEAVVAFREAVRLAPATAGYYYNLGSALLTSGNFKEAGDALREAIRLQPDNAYAHNLLGIALARQHEYRKALDHFTEASTLQPDDPAIMENLRQARRILSGHSSR